MKSEARDDIKDESLHEQERKRERGGGGVNIDKYTGTTGEREEIKSR